MAMLEMCELVKGRWRGARGGRRIVIWRPEAIGEAARDAGIRDESKDMRRPTAATRFRSGNKDEASANRAGEVNNMEFGEKKNGRRRGAWLHALHSHTRRYKCEPRLCPPVAGDLKTVWRCGFSAGTALPEPPGRAPSHRCTPLERRRLFQVNSCDVSYDGEGTRAV
jgi:hypothetical protein